MAQLNKNPAQFAEDKNRLQVAAETGHTLCAYLDPEGESPPGRANQPKVLADWREDVAKRNPNRLGAVRDRLQFIAGNVFPNFGWIPGSYTIRQYHPRGPDATEVWSYCLVDAAAPQATKDAMRRIYTNGFGPSGLLEQDDGENWSHSTRGAKGTHGRTRRLNISMGMGADTVQEDPSGQSRIETVVNEHGQRWHYQSWQEWMNAESWEELKANHSTPPTAEV